MGSTFFFTVKLSVQKDQIERGRGLTKDEKPAPVPADLNRLASGMRILLADDSEDNRFLILSYLNRTGSFVDIAEDGEAAVRLFRTKRFDVVLMDGRNAGQVDGFTATREIRRFEKAISGRSSHTRIGSDGARLRGRRGKSLRLRVY